MKVVKALIFLLVFTFLSSYALYAQEHLPVPSRERIKEIAKFLPDEPRGIGYPISERHFWDDLADTEQADRVIQKASELLSAKPLPVNKEQWMAYIEGKTERQNYETPFWEQQRRFCTFVLAEALENEGRFIPVIERLLQDMLSLGTWKKPQTEDADEDYWYGRKHFLDLAVAQRSFTVATADFWLQDKVNPEIRRKLREYIRKDALDPYLKRLNTPGEEWFWMKGNGNWNAVCHAGVVGAALSILEDPIERANIIAGAELGKEYYLDGFGDEGYCNEGIGYWRYGFGHFMVLSEIIRVNTKNSIDWLNDVRAFQVALYPSRIEILNGIYPSFSDVDGIYYRPPQWMVSFAEERFGKRKNIIQFWRVAMLDEITDLYFYGLMHLKDFPIYDFDLNTDNSKFHTEVRDFYQEGGLLITRPFSRDPRGMATSIKGGHNSEHHNHNDLGTYEVVLAGEKLIVDPGKEHYGRGTSKSRYESEMMNSFGHSVPIVAGQLQSPGRKSEALILEKDFSLLKDYIKYDLSRAYSVNTLKSLTRSFTYKRGKTSEIIVIDEVEYTTPEKFETGIIIDTYNEAIRDQLSCRWELIGENKWLVRKGDKAIQIVVSSPGNEITFWTKPLEALPTRMPEGYNPIRLCFAVKDEVKSAQIKIQIKPIVK